jgi:hypothetical protein
LVNVTTKELTAMKSKRNTLLILKAYLAAMLRVANRNSLAKFQLGREILADRKEERSPSFLSQNRKN